MCVFHSITFNSFYSHEYPHSHTILGMSLYIPWSCSCVSGVLELQLNYMKIEFEQCIK